MVQCTGSLQIQLRLHCKMLTLLYCCHTFESDMLQKNPLRDVRLHLQQERQELQERANFLQVVKKSQSFLKIAI